MELKQLAAYFAHGLQVKIDLHFYKNYEVFEVVSLSENDVELADSKGNYVGGTFELCDIKPILRPMSHLTKEIEHKGEKLVAHKILWDIGKDMGYSYIFLTLALGRFSKSSNLEHNVNVTPCFIIQKLLEWHFDVFGLIEKGDAIAKE